ncbi:MAG: hypothetical protein GTO18_20900 [Anaerolineales bacterium]|nr:hypothetical protein [Anaerolineales bacterium]
MDSFEKLTLVARACDHEADGEISAHQNGISYRRDQAALDNPTSRMDSSKVRMRKTRRKADDIPIHNAVGPHGRPFPLLKSMLTTVCEMDCYYCAFRSGRDIKRVTFRPEELAQVFYDVHQSGAVEGLFLSTGIFSGGANTQNRLLDTAEILRRRIGFQGYLHLKIMPGAEQGQVLRAMQLADRVSVNLEAPNASRLASLAPHKKFAEQLLVPFQWMEEIRQNHSPSQTWHGRWPSSTTQFVVGPAGENDLELLATVASLTRSPGFARAYFEAFNPVPGTPLENHRPEDPWRQHRLYQASFLLRDYGFDLEELPFTQQGNLPIEKDPKETYAERTYRRVPLEVNKADRSELLRIPGIGPRGANAILNARRERTLSDLSQLRKLGILAERAAPYIVLNGRQPLKQLNLFS